MAISKNIQEKHKENLKQKDNRRINPRVMRALTIGLLGGFLAGWGLSYYTYVHNTTLSDKRLLLGTSQYKYINPFVLTAVYDSITNKELRHFRDLIFERCKEAEEKGDVVQASFYFRDFTNGLWFGSGERTAVLKMREAKVPIMIAALMRAEKEAGYLDKKLLFKPGNLKGELREDIGNNPPATFMIDGGQYSVFELIELMIIRSDERAAQLLLEDVGVNYYNALNNRLGIGSVPDGFASPNELSLKGYSAFFRMLYNASLLSREYSELALDVLSRADNVLGIREAVPKAVPICQRFGEKLLADTSLVKSGPYFQMHNAAIVYYPGKTYFLGIVARGNDKLKMQNLLRDIAKIAHTEVDTQMKQIKSEDSL